MLIRNYIKYLFIITALIACNQNVAAQSKRFLAKLDTNFQPDTLYYHDYLWEDFYDYNIADIEFDITDYDQDLLNASVFFATNKYRSSKNKEPLKYSLELHKVAYNYAAFNHYKRFINNKKNNTKILKGLLSVCRTFHFTGSLVNANIAYPYAVDFNSKRKFYFDRKDEETVTQLFYGKRPKSKYYNKKKEPVLLDTYQSFAEKLVKEWHGRATKKKTKSKAYEYMACYIIVEPKTVRKRRIPRARAIQIFGGYRISWDEE